MNFAPLLSYIENHISLTEDERLFLQSKIKFRSYLKGQFIVQQGDVCTTTNFIVTGCTKMFHADAEGMEHIVMFCHSVLLQKPRRVISGNSEARTFL